MPDTNKTSNLQKLHTTARFNLFIFQKRQQLQHQIRPPGCGCLSTDIKDVHLVFPTWQIFAKIAEHMATICSLSCNRAASFLIKRNHSRGRRTGSPKWLEQKSTSAVAVAQRKCAAVQNGQQGCVSQKQKKLHFKCSETYTITKWYSSPKTARMMRSTPLKCGRMPFTFSRSPRVGFRFLMLSSTPFLCSAAKHPSLTAH